MKQLFKLFFCVLSIYLNAQVGINTNDINPNASLHVSEKNPENEILKKGILIPRLTEQQRDEIVTTEIDNSLTIFNTTEDCYNYWHVEEQEWKSLCGNEGDAKYTYTCGSIAVYGEYIKEKMTDTSHYILLTVNVIKKGNYTIVANPTTSNGYSFVAQGNFNTLGTQTIKIPAQGTPINATPVATPNVFTIDSSQGKPDPADVACTFNVNVKENIAGYSIDCANLFVRGTYRKGTAVSAVNNYIEVVIQVNTLGSYNITTNYVNGIRFTASGNFTTTGRQTIRIYAEGTPTVNEDISVKVITNSVAGTTSCDAIVPITLPPLTYAVIGDNNVYTWHPSNIRAKAFNSTSFGPNGVVRVVSLTNAWSTKSIPTAVTNLINSTPPDVILYFAYGSDPMSTALADELLSYVNRGGVLIYGSKDENFNDVNTLMTGIFGASYAVARKQIAGIRSTDDNVHPVLNNNADPIVNGPFGSVAGKYWAEDNTSIGTIVLPTLPPNSVQLVSANNQFSKYEVDPEVSVVWYNNSKNFVFFGDSTGSHESNTSLTDFPTIYVNGVPKTKRYGQYPDQATQSQFVINSFLELNAIAWALKKAATTGINPH